MANSEKVRYRVKVYHRRGVGKLEGGDSQEVDTDMDFSQFKDVIISSDHGGRAGSGTPSLHMLVLSSENEGKRKATPKLIVEGSAATVNEFLYTDIVKQGRLGSVPTVMLHYTDPPSDEAEESDEGATAGGAQAEASPSGSAASDAMHTPEDEEGDTVEQDGKGKGRARTQPVPRREARAGGSSSDESMQQDEAIAARAGAGAGRSSASTSNQESLNDKMDVSGGCSNDGYSSSEGSVQWDETSTGAFYRVKVYYRRGGGEVEAGGWEEVRSNMDRCLFESTIMERDHSGRNGEGQPTLWALMPDSDDEEYSTLARIVDANDSGLADRVLYSEIITRGRNGDMLGVLLDYNEPPSGQAEKAGGGSTASTKGQPDNTKAEASPSGSAASDAMRTPEDEEGDAAVQDSKGKGRARTQPGPQMEARGSGSSSDESMQQDEAIKPARRRKGGTMADFWKLRARADYWSERYDGERDGGATMEELGVDHPWIRFCKVSKPGGLMEQRIEEVDEEEGGSQVGSAMDVEDPMNVSHCKEKGKGKGRKEKQAAAAETKGGGAASDDKKEEAVEDSGKGKKRHKPEKPAAAGTKEGNPRKKPKKDLNVPKRAVTAYMIFTSESRQKISEENPGVSPQDIFKLVAEKWKALDDKGRQVYKDKARLDQARYDAEMAEYLRNKPPSEPGDEEEMPDDSD